MLVKEIKNIAQLMTMTSYDEVVVDTSKALLPGMPSVKYLSGKTQLVIIAKGQVIAGVDLNELSKEAIFIKDDSVSLALPHSKVLDAIVNPSQFEIFIEGPGWSEEDFKILKVKARELIVNRSLQKEILQKADIKTLQIMEKFLRSVGFNRLSIYFR